MKSKYAVKKRMIFSLKTRTFKSNISPVCDFAQHVNGMKLKVTETEALSFVLGTKEEHFNLFQVTSERQVSFVAFQGRPYNLQRKKFVLAW